MKKLEATQITASVTTDGTSSWFSGHFPNNPILPGIAQLKMVADLIARPAGGNLRLAGLSRVKFRKIVRPCEQLDIHVTCDNAKHHYMFRITSGDDDVCSGKIDFTHNETLRIHE